jgi:hypothetical protein
LDSLIKLKERVAADSRARHGSRTAQGISLEREEIAGQSLAAPEDGRPRRSA